MGRKRLGLGESLETRHNFYTVMPHLSLPICFAGLPAVPKPLLPRVPLVLQDSLCGGGGGGGGVCVCV